ncbi:MAG: 4-(cytidine 5'-diphospho)-2-C-methyl-D-erythritol kinase [Bacteroidetes bacterium 4572_77]|nr:MAG: 4-(cytidine 5'-diphospho)-2-C-methyl-D-erythritol kinase [Bacteroidetes bacterium 4572_77]
MIGFAPAKINLGLSVFGKRADGFHELDSYLYSIPFYDILEIQEAPQDLFTLSGLPINTLPENNLAISALNLLKAQVRIPPVHIHLHKQIPVQAGLGGGSSDAISVLKLLNKFFKLNINKTLMLEMALKLGSDCPFFITSAASKISGRGEILEKASLYKNRAIYASLSGSGSALFGIFENEPAIEFKSDYLVWQQQL